MHRPVRRNTLNHFWKINPSIFPLVQANCENCVPNIIPRELRFCMIFEKNTEISIILQCADFVSIPHFGYCIPYLQRDTKFSLFVSRNIPDWTKLLRDTRTAKTVSHIFLWENCVPFFNYSLCLLNQSIKPIDCNASSCQKKRAEPFMKK